MEYKHPILVALKGPLASGKTAGADFLVEKNGFVRVAFADALKIEIFDSLLSRQFPYEIVSHFGVEELAKLSYPAPPVGIIGLDPHYTDPTKIKWINKHKTELRAMLQYWGTEYRRAQNLAYWIDKFHERVSDYLNEGLSVVCDDCRFPNEDETVKNLGGYIIFLDTPAEKRQTQQAERDGKVVNGIAGHASENFDPSDPLIDYTIKNDQTLELYLFVLNDMVSHLLEKHQLLHS